MGWRGEGMRSEVEIRTAVRHFIASDEGFLAAFIEGCCIEQMQTLEAAITELLALRRRLGDKDAIVKIIFENKTGPSDDIADAVVKYLDGTDGA